MKLKDKDQKRRGGGGSEENRQSRKQIKTIINILRDQRKVTASMTPEQYAIFKSGIWRESNNKEELLQSMKMKEFSTYSVFLVQTILWGKPNS